jgi:hypothetical protein
MPASKRESISRQLIPVPFILLREGGLNEAGQVEWPGAMPNALMRIGWDQMQKEKEYFERRQRERELELKKYPPERYPFGPPPVIR